MKELNTELLEIKRWPVFIAIIAFLLGVTFAVNDTIIHYL